jgi:uncharacterized membrane protein
MTLQPYLDASLIVQVHVIAAAMALFIGPFALWRKRRDRLHKVLGYVWVLSFGFAAFIALFIPSHFTPIGLGPIHALSVYGLYGIYEAMRAIYRRDIVLHKLVMQNLYVRGIALAGAFNFLPGRTTQRALIPDTPELGYAIIAAVLVWAFVPIIRASLASRGSVQDADRAAPSGGDQEAA